LFYIHITGQNNQAGKSILKTDYKPENTVEQNLKVAVKILLKTMDSTTPSPERIELSTLKRAEDGSMVHYTLSDAEVGKFIDEITKEIEEEQKKEQSSTGDI
jgi:20S proteasome subunit alpha 3